MRHVTSYENRIHIEFCGAFFVFKKEQSTGPRVHVSTGPRVQSLFCTMPNYWRHYGISEIGSFEFNSCVNLVGGRLNGMFIFSLV